MNYARYMWLMCNTVTSDVWDWSGLVSVYRDLDHVTGCNLDVVVSLDYSDQITPSPPHLRPGPGGPEEPSRSQLGTQWDDGLTGKIGMLLLSKV